MIFASDLDRTLIFSKKFLEQYPSEGMILVEQIKDREISYISNNVLERLKELNQEVLFVPTTTRTMEQYLRIKGIAEGILPSYAVTSNGGNILYQGKVLQEWNQRVKDQLSKIVSAEEIERAFLEAFIERDWLKAMVYRDELFWSLHIVPGQEAPQEELRLFGQWLKEQGWELSIQGSKIYFIPSMVNKAAAISYIAEREGLAPIVTAGDSLLDSSILALGDFSICASHGELVKQGQHNRDELQHMIVTSVLGVGASIEILDYVEEIQREEKKRVG